MQYLKSLSCEIKTYESFLGCPTTQKTEKKIFQKTKLTPDLEKIAIQDAKFIQMSNKPIDEFEANETQPSDEEIENIDLDSIYIPELPKDN
ncbi:MAG: hypothetical protein JNJ40_09070 [Bacteroidia bacterium]|nr:hypothetical protein [Bacteroidia bacterium]